MVYRPAHALCVIFVSHSITGHLYWRLVEVIVKYYAYRYSGKVIVRRYTVEIWADIIPLRFLHYDGGAYKFGREIERKLHVKLPPSEHQ